MVAVVVTAFVMVAVVIFVGVSYLSVQCVVVKVVMKVVMKVVVVVVMVVVTVVV